MKRIEDVFYELPYLETERLILRKISIDDREDMFNYASDPEVSRYTAWSEHKILNETEEFILKIISEYENRRGMTWGIVCKDNMKFIGTCGFMRWSPGQAIGELGYALSRAYWNNGYMTEAVKRLIVFGYEQMDLNRIEARCIVDNVGSAKVMVNSGMKFEGILRQQLYVKGHFHDIKIHSMVKSDMLRR
ncbi:MAG: GNAT family N-acetyltransferase [Clostridium sp.]|uniref:GNAT family N-acetyltransferase n=1 Tax=Clostridium sp. TaxID=1506 RepID=UPI003D6D23D0